MIWIICKILTNMAHKCHKTKLEFNITQSTLDYALIHILLFVLFKAPNQTISDILTNFSPVLVIFSFFLWPKMHLLKVTNFNLFNGFWVLKITVKMQFSSTSLQKYHLSSPFTCLPLSLFVP